MKKFVIGVTVTFLMFLLAWQAPAQTPQHPAPVSAEVATLAQILRDPENRRKFANYQKDTKGIVSADLMIWDRGVRLTLFPKPVYGPQGELRGTIPTLDLTVEQEWEMRDEGLTGKVTLGNFYIKPRAQKLTIAENTLSKDNQVFWDTKYQDLLEQILGKLAQK